MSEEEQRKKLDRLKAVRRGHRGVITKLCREVDEIVNGDEEAMNPIKVSRLNVIFEQFDAKLKVFSSLDGEIVSLCPEEEIEREIEDSESITAKIIESKRKIDSGLKGSSDARPVRSSATGGIHSDAATVNRPRLPKLTLAKFRGDVTAWSSFWDSYKSAVHENPDISVIDKFNYLNSLLEGPASRTIQGLKLSESNYNSAVALLKERFGKPQHIISAHMEELIKIQPCTGDKPSALRFVYDKINVNIRGLAAMGIDSGQYGSLLIPVIMTKLPQELRLRVARETDKEVWEIDELMAVLRKEVEAREATEVIKLTQVRTPSGFRGPAPPTPTAATLLTSGSPVRCVYCHEAHYSASCTKIRTPSERKAILIRSGRCFNCLRANHKLRECESSKTCRHCNRKHHQSICDKVGASESPPNRTNEPAANKEPNNDGTSTSTNTTNVSKNRQAILLQTAHAKASASVSGPSVPVRVLFDNGSQLSYVTERLQRQLSLKPTRVEKLHLNTFGHDGYKTQTCAIVKLYIQGLHQGEIIGLSAMTSPSICSPLPSAIRVNNYPHLQGLQLADECDLPRQEVDVLVGSNFYWNIVTGDIVRAQEGPVAVSSKLGWLLSGPIDSCEVTPVSHACVVVSGIPANPQINEREDMLISSLRDFWNLESLGIAPSLADTCVSSLFPPAISLCDNRYSVSLPWKPDHPEIPDHLSLCESRLKSLIKRLQSNPRMLLEYDKIIKEQLKSGIIEIIKPESPSETSQDGCCKPRLHYLPHHGVVRQDSQTTKLRIVYNGSARALGDMYSLNDCLQTGPNYIPKLFNILIRFRWHKIAITADIEKAFLMIGIDQADRDLLRFLWVKDPFKSPYELIHLRFTRLVFGLRPSPAILGSVLWHHIKKFESEWPELTKKLKDSFYVDDLIAGASDVKGALDFCVQSKRIMAAAGMNLRKWNSNSHELTQLVEETQPTSLVSKNIEEEDETYARAVIGHGVSSSTQTSRILGVMWNSDTDVFSFNFTQLCEHTKTMEITKRSILRLTAKIFDPLGLVSPFVIQLKILFQNLCTGKVEWDAPLSGKLLDNWRNIISELGYLDGVKVSRCYLKFNSRVLTTQLHGFSDASELAFAAVVYMRSLYEDGSIKVSLVASKTRVAPTKKQTIPRLELLGAVILSRLMNNIVASLGPMSTFYWTDSMATLHWIRVVKPWKQYVSHRVAEICRLTKREQWQHCSGYLNPADIPSRGMSGKNLSTNNIWWDGPDFLKLSDSHWPRADAFPPSKTTETEVIKGSADVTHVLLNNKDGELSIISLDKIIDCERYSSYNKLLRVTTCIIQFKNSLRRFQTKQNQEVAPVIYKNQFTGEDINAAEVLWIRSIQAKSFSVELSYLSSKSKQVPPVRVSQFGLFLDDLNLLRCRGRINNSQLATPSKNPILLPSNHHWVKLLVQHVHHEIKHSGTADTLSTIREKYWILKGRQTVKKIIRSCVTCNKLEGLPYSSVVPPDLPGFRSSDDPPFSHTGIDFAGPLFVKVEDRSDKAYVCLFTCSSTRAVHLELTSDLSVSSFLLLFRRFVSRRGLPVTLISDNAKTFRSASKEVLNIARSTEVINYLSNRRVTWKFIVERAPWWGGFWERLIRSVKRSLKKSIGRSSLTYEQLNTLIVEVEAIINARPLTYIADDQDGISGCLSPSHLIYGRRITAMPNSEFFEVVSTHQSLTKKLKHHRHLLNQFTNQWKRDYLLNLRESHTLKVKKGGRQMIKKGDVVLLKNDTSKRLFWKLAIVSDLLEGTDSQVRAAIVKVLDSRGGVKLLRRSIKHLYPVEISPEELSSTPAPSVIDDTPELNPNESTSRRPRRLAAIMGEHARRNT